MRHVTIKLHSGKSEPQKSRIAEEVAKAVAADANCADASVPVSIEDVAPEEWAEKAYRPDIIGKPGLPHKKPGYDSL